MSSAIMQGKTQEKTAAPGGHTVAAFARGPVFAVAGLTGLLLLALSGRYGYWSDELYYLAAGKHLAWGYADQPPLVPLLAAAMDAIAPGSVSVLRLPAVLATVGGVVCTALIARELGGRRRAQTVAAAAFATCTQFLGTGHYLATHTLDPVLWTALLWLVVRWVRTRDDNLLLWAGVVTAVAINVKFLIPVFWVAVGLAALASGPRELMRRPKLWLGLAIAVAATVPTLLWQATHGWPQLRMGSAIKAEVAEEMGGRLAFLPTSLLLAGLPVGTALVVFGLWRLMRSADLRPYRFLGWATLGVAAVFIAANGRYYYLDGMFGICWAVAAVELERKQRARVWRGLTSWPAFLLTGALSAALMLPLYPQSSLPARRPALLSPLAWEEIGWPGVADSVAAAYHRLPPGQQRKTAIVTSRYGVASALDRYGPERGLPEAASPNRGSWYLATPDVTTDSVLFVGNDPSLLRGHFFELNRVGQVDNGAGVQNISQGTAIWLAVGRTEPWPLLWLQLRSFATSA